MPLGVYTMVLSETLSCGGKFHPEYRPYHPMHYEARLDKKGKQVEVS